MCWKVEYVVLIIASTISVYVAGVLIEKHKESPHKKWLLVITLLFNLGILFVFKYYNFFNDTLQLIVKEFNIFYHSPTLKLLLPVGISFYTFQVSSYLIDIYRGERAAEKHLGLFAVFVAFFPQLVAGPIERSKNLLPQFYEEHEFDYNRVAAGLKLIAWGLFKKIVIADRIAVYVNQVFNNPSDYTGAPVALAALFFTIQVYCDFSGYSDMAIGSAQVLGFRLMKNFNRPYYAKSISEFWRRWHISLSTWFDDYVYKPILINRRDWGLAAIYFSLCITFFASGLWHGANWTFIVWGLLHGLMLSLEVITKKSRKKVKKAVPEIIYNNTCMMLTFLFICFVNVFFRANSLSDAVLIIEGIVNIDSSNLSIAIPQMDRMELLMALVSIGILESVHLIQRRVQIRQFVEKMNFIIRWSLYTCFIGYILFFRAVGAEFIYFQF
jgi:D-alanyl-lipoteichoic acid acyltransferase DltB (MBOAT superfamily)